jgi:hypothetical protein
MANDTKSRVNGAEKHLPLAVPVHVQCEGFRCLAYRDKKGNWINYHNRDPINGIVRLIEYDGNRD